MTKLTEEQRGYITKNAELFLQIYEEGKRAAISYGLPREEWQSFVTVFTLADLVSKFMTSNVMHYMDAKIRELDTLMIQLEAKLNEIAGK